MKRQKLRYTSQRRANHAAQISRTVWRRVAASAGLLLALLAAGTTPAHAMARLGGTDVVVPETQVIDDDLFVIAQSFTLDGTVNGDLIVFAGSITINGTVQNDLEGAGQALVINGAVGEDVRVAAVSIALGPEARLSDDLLSAAVRLEGQPGSRIDGQLLHLGLQTVVEGSIGGPIPPPTPTDATLGGSTRSSPAPASATATPRPSGATGQGGPNGGDQGITALVAWQPAVDPNAVNDTAPPGQDSPPADADAVGEGTGPAPLDWLMVQLRRMAALLLVGLVIVWLLPDKTTAGADRLARGPLPSLGWGVVAIPALVMAFLVALTATLSLVYVINTTTLDNLLGLVLALGALSLITLVVVWILAVSYIGYIVAALAIGRLILRRAKPEWAAQPYIPLALGTLILVLLMSVPRLGNVIGLLALFMGLGALWLLWRDKGYAWPRRASSAPTEAATNA